MAYYSLGKRRWSFWKDSSISVPMIQPSDMTQVHRPSTQACLCKAILLQIHVSKYWRHLATIRKGYAKTLGLALTRILNSNDQNFFFKRQVAILRSHWGLWGVSMDEEGNAEVFHKKMTRGVVPHRDELV